MRKNVYFHELHMRARSVLYWSLGVLAVHLVYLSLFPSVSRQAALFREAMADFPPEFLAAFGMNGVDLSTVLGFYSFVFLFTQVLLAIQASNYGFGLVSVEESGLTADFLLSKPVSRSEILGSKLLAAFTALTVTNGVTWASAFGLIELFRGNRPYDPRTLALLLASIVVFQLFFLSVGLLLSLLVGRIRSVTPYGLGLAFGMYVLGAFGNMLGDVKLEWVTPFRHFDAACIVRRGGYDVRVFWLDMAVIAVALAASYWRYLRRDIPAVV